MQELVVHPSLRLPAITFCSEVPYKSLGYFFNVSAFDTYAYQFDEIFDKEAKLNLEEKVKARRQVRDGEKTLFL